MRRLQAWLFGCLCLGLAACLPATAQSRLDKGQLDQLLAPVALYPDSLLSLSLIHIYGLEIKLVKFNDYQLPNAALNAGDLDANAFQHKPFLDNQIKARGFDIVPVGLTVTAPLGLSLIHI